MRLRRRSSNTSRAPRGERLDVARTDVAQTDVAQADVAATRVRLLFALCAAAFAAGCASDGPARPTVARPDVQRPDSMVPEGVQEYRSQVAEMRAEHIKAVNAQQGDLREIEADDGTGGFWNTLGSAAGTALDVLSMRALGLW